MEYGDGLTFALLSLLFPFVDLRNQFHVDHIFPRARFTENKLRATGVINDNIEHFIQLRDTLANLQLLDGAANNEKRTKMPSDWLSETQREDSGRQAYQERHLLGDVPMTMAGFIDFYDARRARLKTRIGELLRR